MGVATEANNPNATREARILKGFFLSVLPLEPQILPPSLLVACPSRPPPRLFPCAFPRFPRPRRCYHFPLPSSVPMSDVFDPVPSDPRRVLRPAVCRSHQAYRPGLPHSQSIPTARA